MPGNSYTTLKVTIKYTENNKILRKNQRNSYNSKIIIAICNAHLMTDSSRALFVLCHLRQLLFLQFFELFLCIIWVIHIVSCQQIEVFLSPTVKYDDTTF